MPRRLHGLLGFALLIAFGGGAAAQQTSEPKPAPVPDPPGGQTPRQIPDPPGGQTPAVAPKTVSTPVPPPVALPTAPAAADIVSRPLSAEEAVRIALRKQPNVEVARAGIAAAQGRTEQARAALLPSLGVSGGYNNVTVLSGASSSTSTTNSTGGNTGGTTGGASTATSGNSGSGGSSGSTGFTAQAVVRQLLFDFNHTRELVRQSQALSRAAKDNLTRVQSDLVSQVKQAYYQVVQSDRLAAVNEDNLQNRRSQRDLARARLNSGLGLPSDVATAETAYSEAVLNLTVAQNTAAITRVNLAALMGVDARTPLATVEGGEPAVPSDDVDALVAQALKQRPEMLQAQSTVDANRHAVSAAKTTNAPAVSGAVGFASRGREFPPRDDGLTIGATVTFTPFDGGLTQGRVKEARANLDSAGAQLQGTRLTVTSDVAQSWLNMRTAEQRVATAAIEVANATEGVRIATGRYSSGLGLFQDILTTQSLLLTARTNLVNAQAQVDTSRAALRRAIGAPPPVVR